MIGVSFQQAELAEASVRDNIAYGRTFDAAAMGEAIVLTNLQGVLDDLRHGLDTMGARRAPTVERPRAAGGTR